jgi:hypothetical protein
MNENEIRQVIIIMRRAPLHNMEEAETVSKLMDKLIAALRERAAPAPAQLRVVESEDSSGRI